MIKEVKSPDTERESRVPPNQNLVEEIPVLQKGDIPNIQKDDWKLKISGSVEEKEELTYEEFKELPRVKVHADIHCVTGWTKLNVEWEGVSTEVLNNIVKIKPKAEHVMIHSIDDYTTNLRLEDFFAEDVLLADTLNNEELKPQHGYPVRLVLPRLYLWKSAKWISEVEFMPKDRPGFWEKRGYHNRGDPWKEERYSGE